MFSNNVVAVSSFVNVPLIPVACKKLPLPEGWFILQMFLPSEGIARHKFCLITGFWVQLTDIRNF